MVIAGIDPGNTGAIVLLEINSIFINCFAIYDMPILKTEGKGKTKKGKTKIHTVLDENEIKTILQSNTIKHVFLEKAQSMPGQGAPATFNYACGFGILRGICVGIGIPYTLIHPATWKRAMMKDMDKGKNAAIVRAKQLFPQANIGKKDGRAEALLLTVYGIRENLGISMTTKQKIIRKKGIHD